MEPGREVGRNWRQGVGFRAVRALARRNMTVSERDASPLRPARTGRPTSAPCFRPTVVALAFIRTKATNNGIFIVPVLRQPWRPSVTRCRS